LPVDAFDNHLKIPFVEERPCRLPKNTYEAFFQCCAAFSPRLPPYKGRTPDKAGLAAPPLAPSASLHESTLARPLWFIHYRQYHKGIYPQANPARD